MTADAGSLIAHVRSRIAAYKAPRYVELVDALPKTSTGKIQKFALRSLTHEGAVPGEA
ncbi:hypothetical protein PQI23_05470 [Leucobacter sp. USCH14]|uniref:AMP-binding enzyme n=1 Tax=Leucobacter sp. USCH14 TaxID=3024838 RepID=UPI0030AAE165